MSERRTSNWLTSFVEYASHGEAPTKTLFWTGVSTIAGALRRKVWIEQNFYQWTPCFYIILTAPSGIISKTTTANIGINLLREVPGIKFGPDIVTWQALVECFANSTDSFFETDTGLYHTQSAITLCSDELGNLVNTDDQGMVNVLIHLWDGKQGAFQKVTKGSGEDNIVNPWINILACTTPAWIKKNFDESMIGGGFSSRCIFVYADKKRQYVAYPARRMPKNINEQKADLIHDLEIIASMVGEYRMTDEAMDWGEEWYKTLKDANKTLNADQFGGYFSRKQAHVHKLAMVLAAAQSSELILDLPTLQLAKDFVDALEKEMGQVFATIGQTQVGRGISELSRIVTVKRKITKSNLYRELSNTMGAREFEAALHSAQLAGHIKLESSMNTVYIVACNESKGE